MNEIFHFLSFSRKASKKIPTCSYMVPAMNVLENHVRYNTLLTSSSAFLQLKCAEICYLTCATSEKFPGERENVSGDVKKEIFLSTFREKLHFAATRSSSPLGIPCVKELKGECVKSPKKYNI